MSGEKAKAGGFSLAEVVRAAKKEVEGWPEWKRARIRSEIENLHDTVAKEFDMARPKQLEAPVRDGSEVPLAITNPLVTRAQQ